MDRYRIISALTTDELERKVSELVVAHWVPIGGHQYVGKEFHRTVQQAVYLPLEK
jgi:hypothetical protein